MSLPTLDGVGSLITDIRRGLTASGKRWAGGTVRFTSRKKAADGKWEDDVSIVVSVVGFDQAAEELARYAKGDVITVVGRIKSLGLWQPKTGGPRPELSMFLDHVSDPPPRTREQPPTASDTAWPRPGGQESRHSPGIAGQRQPERPSPAPQPAGVADLAAWRDGANAKLRRAHQTSPRTGRPA